MSEYIDLRSDTVTRPTTDMRQAMASADVGDDVYGEDPTVNRLEAEAAEAVGKEAAIFVPTGTMGNTIAIKLHTEHGEEVICDARSHIIDWELSMMAWFAGVIPRAVPTERGTLTWQEIAAAIRTRGPHNAPTTLISLENSHNMGGGTVYSLKALDQITGEAHQRGLRVHMDGARVFNAAAALDVPVSRLTRGVDTVMFCLSKGLGAPVGSLLAGSSDHIARARLLRKRLGGGMRQAGVLAAAGLLALRQGPADLEQDHANARWLAERIAQMPGCRLRPEEVQTNIVIFDVTGTGQTAPEISAKLKANGILANGINLTQLRMVTHRDVTRAGCEQAIQVLSSVLAVSKPRPEPVASSV